MSIEELKKLQNGIIVKNKKISTIFKIIIGCVVLFTILLDILGTKILMNSFYFFDIYFLLFPIFFEIVFGWVIFFITRNIILGNDINLFNKNYKKIFVLSALKEIFTDLNYDPNSGVSEEDIKKSGLIYLEDRFSSNDYISGTYKKIRFEQSDVHIEKRVVEEDMNGNKSVRWQTTFMGRWMNFDFNKNFRTNVIVFDSKGFNWWGRYKKITMEDDDFNKQFSVYAENEHEAFYILTPHFMEKIKKLKQNIGNNVTLGFIDSKLYVTLNNYKDSFEYNVFKPIDEKIINSNIMKDIKIITDFVDDLDLDNDLFKERVK